MKKLTAKMILVSFVLSLAATVYAEITSAYEYASPLSALSIQPTPTDLAQLAGTTKTIVKGAMHAAMPEFGYLFNSDMVGSYGPGVDTIFQDGISPDFDTAFHCDFDAPKVIEEVRIFTHWGDQRVFSWFEVWASTTGTNEGDYTYLGTTTLGEIGQDNTVYVGQECVARLYDPDDGVIATDVTSLMLVQKNCGYGISPGLGDKLAPATPLDTNTYNSVTGCTSPEIDIIGSGPTPITNEYYSESLLADLPFQPQSDDLAQQVDATNYIVAGGMHIALSDNKFEYLFNSPVDGELGVGSPDTVGGTEVLLYDAAIPSTLTMEMNCDFTSPKIVHAVQIFSRAGDPRLFTYGEVYYSTTGTNASDYAYIGAVSFGEWGDSSDGYADSYCVARLYDTADGILADNVASIKIKFLGVMDTTWSDLTHKVEGSSGGSAIGEVDILGIPEPCLFIIYYLSFIIYYLKSLRA